MRIGKWARLLLAATPLVAGCAGFWAPPSGSGGSGTTSTTLSSGNFYILSKGSTISQVYGFSIVSGKLTALSGSPYAVTGQAFAMAPGPSGSGYLYVSSTAGVYIYTVNSSSGALTQGAQVSQDLTAGAIQVDPGGAWLIEALDVGSLVAVPITSTGVFDSSTTRAVQQVALAGLQVQQMAISPNHTLIAVALGSAGTQLFPFTSSNTANPIGTALSPTIGTVNTTGVGASVAVSFDPLSRFMYIGETAAFPTSTSSSGGLRAFTIASSPLAVAEFQGSPYQTTGTGPHAIQPIAAGDYVYAASWQGTTAGLITPFQLTSTVSTTGTVYKLTALTSTVATGIQPSGLDEDNLANFMLAVSSGGTPTFSAYIFDTTTIGKLDLTNTDSTAATPAGVTAAP
jgi:hypothetical protein